jgi:hypothetical protein
VTDLASPGALRAWSAAVRTRVEDRVRAALGGWGEAWGVAGPPADAVRCEPLFDAATGRAARKPAQWHPLGDAARGIWCADAVAAHVAEIARALFAVPLGYGRSGASGMAGEIARAAWDDWAGRLSTALGDDPLAPLAETAPGGDVLGPWSGAVVVAAPWCAASIALLVAGDRVARVAGEDGPRSAQPHARGVTSVWRALAGRRARLHAELEPFELDLGAIAGLRVGDVVRTTHALEKPVAVQLDGLDGRHGSSLCEGFLGTSRGARAIELLPLPGPPQATARAPGPDSKP